MCYMCDIYMAGVTLHAIDACDHTAKRYEDKMRPMLIAMEIEGGCYSVSGVCHTLQCAHAHIRLG